MDDRDWVSRADYDAYDLDYILLQLWHIVLVLREIFPRTNEKIVPTSAG